MIFYTSPEEEAGALRRAAARVGARVEALRVKGRRVVGRVICRDGWHAAQFLAALGAEDAKTEGARALADELREGHPDDRSFAEAIVAYVKGNVRFVRDRGEQFSSPGYTLEIGQGDCEDHARLVYAIAIAGGEPARFAFLHRGGGPTHAVAQLCVDGAWTWAETTVDAELGEHPILAARRLGVVQSRGDITEGVRTMSESDLPAPPPGYLKANDGAQIERDATALASLGYLPPSAPRVPGDPADLEFRRAVLAFQRATGIVADGLIGPQTRRTIAGALPEDEAIGYLGEAGSTGAQLTAHLSPGFFRGVERMAADFRALGADVTAEQFLAVWLYESGLRPDIPNRAGAPYYGLNQMGVPQMRAAGFAGSPVEWMALTAEQQLPFVRRYYENTVRGGLGGDWSKLVGVPVLYALNLAPAYATRAADLDAPIARLDSPDATERAVYKGNAGPPPNYRAGLDVDGDGAISGRDLKAAVGRGQRAAGSYWLEARRRLYELGGTEEPPPSGGIAGKLVAGLGVVALVAGAVALSRS